MDSRCQNTGALGVDAIREQKTRIGETRNVRRKEISVCNRPNAEWYGFQLGIFCHKQDPYRAGSEAEDRKHYFFDVLQLFI